MGEASVSALTYRCSRPGDVLIIPESWGHGVLNIQESVAVASEVKHALALWRIRPFPRPVSMIPGDNWAPRKEDKPIVIDEEQQRMQQHGDVRGDRREPPPRRERGREQGRGRGGEAERFREPPPFAAVEKHERAMDRRADTHRRPLPSE